MQNRFLLIGTIMLLAACSQPAAKPAPPPQGFTFRGLVPGVTTVSAAEKSGTVHLCSEGSCMFAKSEVGGVPAGSSTVEFRDGRFDWFSFNPDSEDYEALLAQLVDAYGVPCHTESVPLQNAMGARFSGDEARWCFKDGRLTLRRHSNERRASITQGDLDFFTLHPEDTQPRTGPTPDTL